MNRVVISREQIDRIVYKASLAPSPHNAQGWKFRFDGRVLDLLSDTDSRILRELDPHEKEGAIALGAAVENLVLSAFEEGYLTQISWLPTSEDKNIVATLTFEPTNGTAAFEDYQHQDLYPYIEQRSMNRSKYKQTAVSLESIQELRRIAEEEGLELCVVTDRHRIDKLADLAGEAGRFKFTHEPTHRELVRFLRFTAKEAAIKRNGLSLEHFNIPASLARYGRLAMDWRVTRWFNKLGYHHALAFMQETKLVRSAPAVCMLRTRDGGRIGYLQGGRVFQRIMLAAAKYRLAIQPHSAIADLGFARLAGYDTSIPKDWQQKIERFPERLRSIFGVQEESHIINVFRMGYPMKTLQKKSLRRPLEDLLESSQSDESCAIHEEYYQELTKRNFPFIGTEDQRLLKKSRIAVAGCGSIGGASLEVLARMGAEHYLLAEPDTYELNNLNRQNATWHDIGKHKALVLLERMKQINPHIQGYVLNQGLAPQNIHYFVGSSSVIIDGVDITEKSALQAKILLHEEAWRQQKTVISGYDIAGTQMIKIYDYPSGKIRPLYGKFEKLNLEHVSPLTFLSQVISPLDLPVEMLPVTEAMIKGSRESIPQLGPTANLFGVLSSWAVVDILSGRSVRHKVSIDIANMLRPNIKSLKTELKRVIGIVQLKRLLIKVTRAKKRSQAGSPQKTQSIHD